MCKACVEGARRRSMTRPACTSMVHEAFCMHVDGARGVLDSLRWCAHHAYAASTRHNVFCMHMHRGYARHPAWACTSNVCVRMHQGCALTQSEAFGVHARVEAVRGIQRVHVLIVCEASCVHINRVQPRHCTMRSMCAYTSRVHKATGVHMRVEGAREASGSVGMGVETSRAYI